MTRQTKLIITVALAMVLAFGAGGLCSALIMNHAEGGRVSITAADYQDLQDAANLGQMIDLIDANYYTDYDKAVLYENAAKGMAAGLGDRYAEYYTADEYAAMLSRDAGNYEGIGVQVMLNSNGDGLLVTTVFTGSPALEAGLQKGDVVVSADGNDLSGLTLSEATGFIKGEIGTTVELGVLRGDELLTLTVARAPVVANRVIYSMIGEYGYIQLSSFNGDCVEGFTDALTFIRDAGAVGVILDLRDNTGGYMDDAVAIADMLLGEGTVVYYTNKDGTKVEYTSDAKTCLGLPLAVLVNGYSASASEVLCGAIRDHGAGVLVGTQTYGKGVLQKSFYLLDGSVLKMTAAHYYSPAGYCIDGDGFTPDYVVEPSGQMNPYDDDYTDDAQLTKAIEVLDGMISAQ